MPNSNSEMPPIDDGWLAHRNDPPVPNRDLWNPFRDQVDTRYIPNAGPMPGFYGGSYWDYDDGGMTADSNGLAGRRKTLPYAVTVAYAKTLDELISNGGFTEIDPLLENAQHSFRTRHTEERVISLSKPLAADEVVQSVDDRYRGKDINVVRVANVVELLSVVNEAPIMFEGWWVTSPRSKVELRLANGRTQERLLRVGMFGTSRIVRLSNPLVRNSSKIEANTLIALSSPGTAESYYLDD